MLNLAMAYAKLGAEHGTSCGSLQSPCIQSLTKIMPQTTFEAKNFHLIPKHPTFMAINLEGSNHVLSSQKSRND
jgi:hypothetical protein